MSDAIYFHQFAYWRSDLLQNVEESLIIIINLNYYWLILFSD